MKCANSKCDKNPDHSMYSICVTIDGDFVCDSKCEAEYKKQRDHFFNEVVHCPEKTEQWLMGG